jgi:hypothetical protein
MKTWEVDISGRAVEELEESINQGPILDDSGTRYLIERELDRIGGLRIIVYSDEHPPPHFLVRCSEGSRRFRINDCTPLDGSGLEKYLRNIRQWHAKHKQVLINTWNESRPSDCPVGAYRG